MRGTVYRWTRGRRDKAQVGGVKVQHAVGPDRDLVVQVSVAGKADLDDLVVVVGQRHPRAECADDVQVWVGRSTKLSMKVWPNASGPPVNTGDRGEGEQ